MSSIPFVQNVGALCEKYPAYLPHELLGYERDSGQGLRLSMEIMLKVNENQEEASKPRSKRFANFHKNNPKFDNKNPNIDKK